MSNWVKDALLAVLALLVAGLAVAAMRPPVAPTRQGGPLPTPTFSLAPPPESLVVFGDSFVQPDGYPRGLAGALNVVVTPLGVGGTGFTRDGDPTLGRNRYEARIPSIVAAQPSVVLVQVSGNDGFLTDAEIKPAEDSFFDRLRAAVPRAQIVVFGPIFANSSVYGRLPALRALAKAEAARLNLTYIDASDWITQDNAAKYVQADVPDFSGGVRIAGGHPNAAGQALIAAKLVAALTAAKIAAPASG